MRTADGDLFAFGFETDITTDELEELVAGQAATRHGCDAEPLESGPLAAGGGDRILATYDCGGRGLLRWIGTHDGFGLFVGLILASGSDLDEVRTRFANSITELRWTP